VIAMFFEKMLGVHWNKSAQRDSKTLLKMSFSIFEPLLANLALKFQKSANMTQNFVPISNC
jgi:hypothetical protein